MKSHQQAKRELSKSLGIKSDYSEPSNSFIISEILAVFQLWIGTVLGNIDILMNKIAEGSEQRHKGLSLGY